MEVARRTNTRRLLETAAALAACWVLSCSDDAAGPCPHVAESIGIILASSGHELYRQVAAVQEGTITVAAGDRVSSIQCTFLDADGQPIEIGNDCQTNTLAVESVNTLVAAVSRDADQRFFFNVSGVAEGTTTLELRLIHETHSHFSALPIPVVVTSGPP